MKNTSYKLTATLWELKWQSLFLLFSWQTQRNDWYQLVHLDHSSARGWNIPTEEILIFVDFANSFHPTIKSTSEMSREHTVFLSTKIFKGPQLLKFSIHKPTLSSLKLFRILTSHPVTLLKQKRVLSKEKHCLLRTNSVKENFDKHKRDLQQRLRGYPVTFMHKIHTGVQFFRTKTLCNKTKNVKEILPFVTMYNPATPNL